MILSKNVTLAILLVGVLANACWISLLSKVKEFGGDTPYYLALAESLAKSPAEYINAKSFWETSPAMDRAPGWPFLLSLAIRTFPTANRLLLVKSTGAVVSVLGALLLAVLTKQLTRDDRMSLFAGLVAAINPISLSLVDTGGCEPLFVLLATLAMMGMIRGGWHISWGLLLLGAATLVRQFFVLFPFCLFGLLVLRALLRRGKAPVYQPVPLMVGLVLFTLPVGTWVYRNYLVSGEAPVLSTLRGETFYGANNRVVANDLENWGYWIFPDEIPGELPKKELAKKMNQLELDRYYFHKGMSYLSENWFSLPRLLVGKLIRAYVPVPWKPLWPSYIAFSFRILLYMLFSTTLTRSLQACSLAYVLPFCAMLIVSVLTTLIFYGTYRFVYCVEPFLLPLIGLGLLRDASLVIGPWGSTEN